MTLLKDLLKKVCKKEFLDVWFKYSGYVLIAATLVAAGRQSDSMTLQGLGYVSGAAIFIHLINDLVDLGKHYEDDDKNALVNVASMFFIVTLLALLAKSAFPFIESLMQ